MSDLLGARWRASADPAKSGLIKDGSIETFERDVLDASMAAPVIVDFWATWCGPCKQLTPGLEKAVSAAGGAVRLVKIDIDKNKMLATQMRIQSVPTVYAFFQGRPVDGFQGAIPESEIKAFVARLSALAQSGVEAGPDLEAALDAAEAALKSGDVAGAADAFGQIAQFAQDSGEDAPLRAIAGLARCHLSAGDLDAARAVLALAPAEKAGDPAIASVTAALALAGDGARAGDAERLKKRVAAEPGDLEAWFGLAEAQLAVSNMDGAIDALLEIISRDRSWNDEAARKKLLTVFEALGPTDPSTLRGRRRLSSILFA